MFLLGEICFVRVVVGVCNSADKDNILIFEYLSVNYTLWLLKRYYRSFFHRFASASRTPNSRSIPRSFLPDELSLTDFYKF